MRTSVKKFLAPAAVAVAGLVLAGCGGGSGNSGGSGGGTTVDITIKGDTVTPNGDRVDAEVGKPVTLKIHADQAGEIHVHSTPEQHIDFPSGHSTRTLTIDKPGVVDVEDHALDKVIVQLQVS
ncbi:MAG: hypothetical protein ACXVXC_16985 [Nocardioidaceae bacterium]